MAKVIGKLAKRYARALLRRAEKELGREKGSGSELPAQKLARELTLFSEIFQRETDLRNALLSPGYPQAERLRALQAILSELQVSQYVRGFIELAFNRDRLS